jgi:hypothetical protein
MEHPATQKNRTNDVQLIYSRATLPLAKTLIKACGALWQKNTRRRRDAADA